ncbi:unnamed protein product [Miscanthus lutarioriparius]|uniref:Uncharacterized protein n=1 Tax=Miscanthus lutarioriparius TaxID=422564 RepID=A0A811QCL6_9POAL|nr:unnamed protein product [Miscanthus lutarioriparius]
MDLESNRPTPHHTCNLEKEGNLTCPWMNSSSEIALPPLPMTRKQLMLPPLSDGKGVHGADTGQSMVRIHELLQVLDFYEPHVIGCCRSSEVVDLRSYTLETLENDPKARVNWGSGQQPVIHEFDMSGGGKRKVLNDIELSLTFSERMGDKKLFLFVDVEKKPTTITEAATSNVGHDNP